MPNPATVRERRLRKTKAQLIDEIDTLEQRAAAIEATYGSGAPMRAKASDRYFSTQEIADLARFPSENPNPVLRVRTGRKAASSPASALSREPDIEGRNSEFLGVRVC